MNLLHLDISHNGFKPDEIATLGEALRKSKSLLCVHLSGNQLTQQVKDRLLEIVGINKPSSQKESDDPAQNDDEFDYFIGTVKEEANDNKEENKENEVDEMV